MNGEWFESQPNWINPESSKINNVLHFKGYTSGFMVINRKNRDMVSLEDYCFSKWKHTVGVWGYVVEGLLVFNSWLSSSDIRLPALYCNIVFVSDSGISDLCTVMLICGSLAILICPSLGLLKFGYSPYFLKWCQILF